MVLKLNISDEESVKSSAIKNLFQKNKIGKIKKLTGLEKSVIHSGDILNIIMYCKKNTNFLTEQKTLELKLITKIKKEYEFILKIGTAIIDNKIIDEIKKEYDYLKEIEDIKKEINNILTDIQKEIFINLASNFLISLTSSTK